MTPEEQDKLVLRIREYIIRTAETIDLKATFTPVRRKSDLLIVRLSGKYQHAHTMATYLAELFPEIDIEIPKSLQLGNYLSLMVTQKLASQEIMAKERRVKLISVAEEGSETPNQLITAGELYDTLETSCILVN